MGISSLGDLSEGAEHSMQTMVSTLCGRKFYNYLRLTYINSWESCFCLLDPVPIEEALGFIPWEPFPQAGQQSQPKVSFFDTTRVSMFVLFVFVLVSHAYTNNTNPMEAKAPFCVLPALGSRRVKQCLITDTIFGMLVGSAVSGEIKIIRDSGLSRSWAQVFREAWLSQPTTEVVVVLCLSSKLVLHPL